MRAPLAIAPVLLILAGCGSGGPHAYTNTSDLAHDLSCVTYTHTLPPYAEQGMRDLGSCSFSGHHFVLKVYRSGADMQGSLTALSGPRLYARNWVVLCGERVDCQAEQGDVGGTLAR